jgi:hypothetical protein
MSTNSEEWGFRERITVGEDVVVGERTLVPVVNVRIRRLGTTVMGGMHLHGLLIVENGAVYAPLLPPGITLQEFLRATPGLQERVECILNR